MHNTSSDQPGLGLLVTGDLIFGTKITGTARAMRLEVQVVDSPDAAVERIRDSRPRCVWLDLGLASLSPDRIREIVRSAADAPVLAYGAHVDAVRLQEASEAGCREVMPRSRLAATLPALLARYLAG